MKANYELSKKRVTFTVALIGSAEAGKTQFALQLVKRFFNDAYYPTVETLFLTQTVQTENYSIKLQIWDHSGDIRYKEFIRRHTSDKNAIILFVDPTKPLGAQVSDSKDVLKSLPEKTPVIVVMSKSDKTQQLEFTQEELETELNNQEIKNQTIFCISAKTGANIDLVREQLITLSKNWAQEKCEQDAINESKKPFSLSKHLLTWGNHCSTGTISAISHRVMQTMKNNPYLIALLTGAVVLSATGVFAPFGMAAFGIATLSTISAVVFGLAMLVARNLWGCKSIDMNKIKSFPLTLFSPVEPNLNQTSSDSKNKVNNMQAHLQGVSGLIFL